MALGGATQGLCCDAGAGSPEAAPMGALDGAPQLVWLWWFVVVTDPS